MTNRTACGLGLAVGGDRTAATVWKPHHYDMPGQREGNVHIMDGFKATWFTDPDGNILHVNNQ